MVLAYDFYSPTTSTPHHTSKKSTWFANPKDSRRLARFSGRRISHLPQCATGPLLCPQELLFSYRKHLWLIRCKFLFFWGDCFFSLKRATKNIWYSTGWYCNVFVHTSLGRQSSKTSANQWAKKVTREISLSPSSTWISPMITGSCQCVWPLISMTFLGN